MVTSEFVFWKFEIIFSFANRPDRQVVSINPIPAFYYFLFLYLGEYLQIACVLHLYKYIDFKSSTLETIQNYKYLFYLTCVTGVRRYYIPSKIAAEVFRSETSPISSNYGP